MITETDQLSEALSQAGKLWPELAGQRTLLLRKVLEVGVQAIQEEASRKSKNRISSVEKLAGSMNGVWPANWKEEMAKDWPN
jgi:hypothetical protein